MIDIDKIPKHLRNGFSQDFLENAQHYTRRVEPCGSFQQNVKQYTECMRSSDWAVKRSGDKFELAILWGLLLVPEIPAERIRSHVHLLEEAKDAEIDFWIMADPCYGLLPKTSTRERWAQWDRTAIVADMDMKNSDVRKAKLYGIHHNEHWGSKNHPKWQPGFGGEEKNIEFVRNLHEKFVRLHGAFSVYDPKLDDLIDEIVVALHK